VASAAPVTLDSEQKAATGVAAAYWISEGAPLLSENVVYPVSAQADQGLKMVASATSFEALIATQGGISINCPISGTVTAKMANAMPRVLKLQWNDCVKSMFRVEHTFSGPISITLQSDSLVPQRVSAIQMGNATLPFEDKYRYESSDQVDTTTDSYRVNLRGDLSWTRAAGCCEFLGSSSYEVNGIFDEQTLAEYSDGAPSSTFSYKIVPTRVSVRKSASRSDDFNFTDNEYEFLSGTLEEVISGPSLSEDTESYKFNDYRVHQTYDYAAAWRSTLTVDGKVNMTWHPYRGSACTSGLYSFRTKSPIVMPLETTLASSGELVVNGDVNARFFSPDNVPRKLPMPVNGMLLNIRVQDLGTFNYDTGSFLETVDAVGQCLF
jgi:hypothetical protein